MPLELKGTKKHKVLGLVATAIIPKSVYLNGKMATGLYFYYFIIILTNTLPCS